MRASADRSGATLLLIQEGGYARTYAAYCLHATLEGVLGVERLLEDPLAYMPDDPAHAERRHRRGVRRAPSLGFALTRELPFSEDGVPRPGATRPRGDERAGSVDVLFVMSPANLCYLTGFESIWYPPRAPLGVVVSRHDERLLFMDYERHETLVRETAVFDDARLLSATRTRSTRSPRAFRDRGWHAGSVGIEWWTQTPGAPARARDGRSAGAPWERGSWAATGSSIGSGR